MQGAAGGFLVYPGVREGNGVGVMKCERYAVGSSAAGWGGVGWGASLFSPARPCCWWWCVCQLANFSTCREVGKLAGCGG